MIELIILSFVAGVLTVLAPCILPLLPVVVGGSVLHGEAKRSSLRHPIIITASLAVSVIIFTLLLKATTVLLGVPVQVWSVIAGGIIVMFGVNLLLPSLWEKFMIVTGLQAQANRLMGQSQQSSGIKKDILLGASLGPVFNSCSPTYALIVAAVLPASFSLGLIYLTSYAVGLSLILLLISLLGRTFVDKLQWLSRPSSVFKKVIAVIFTVVGAAVIFGVDKQIQAFVLENGWYDPIVRIEELFSK